MANILQKLKTKSKLWAAIVGVLVGVATIFGLDANTIATVSGAVVAVCSVVSYIVTEGKIDAAAVSGAAEKVRAAAESVSDAREAVSADACESK